MWSRYLAGHAAVAGALTLGAPPQGRGAGGAQEEHRRSTGGGSDTHHHQVTDGGGVDGGAQWYLGLGPSGTRGELALLACE